MSCNIYIKPGVKATRHKTILCHQTANIGFNTNLVNDDWGYWLLCEWYGVGVGEGVVENG